MYGEMHGKKVKAEAFTFHDEEKNGLMMNLVSGHVCYHN